MTDGRPIPRKNFLVALFAMIIVVVASNILVQYPVSVRGLEDVLTWGAFPYPFAFLVSDLSNRRFGSRGARRVAYAGFAVAVLVSVYLATPRIAVASGCAFLSSQLLDIFVFSRMSQKRWWLPPFASSLIAAALDTFIFFSFAFYCGTLPFVNTDISSLMMIFGVSDTCQTLPWTTLALGDYSIKVFMGLLALAPYRFLLGRLIPGALSKSKN